MLTKNIEGIDVAPNNSIASVDIRNKRILIAEDDAINVYVLQSFFRNTYLVEHIFVARTGQEAIGIYKNNTIDLVITNYDMPGKNGIEIKNAIRRVEQYTKRYIPIILWSNQDDIVLHYQEHGFDYALDKLTPTRDIFDQLLQRIFNF